MLETLACPCPVLSLSMFVLSLALSGLLIVRLELRRAEWFGVEGAAVGSMGEVTKSVTGNWVYQVFSAAREVLMTQVYVFCSSVFKAVISVAEFAGGLGNS